MPAAKLVTPSAEYKESFLEALQEYQEDGKLKELNFNEIKDNFEAFVRDINDEMGQHHKNLEPWAEKVKETILWLVKDLEYIGYIKIRHRINWHLERYGGHTSICIRPTMRGKGFGKKILQRAVPRINALGIDRALLTIPPDNIKAIRIAELCGGVFQDETTQTDKFPALRRYWLDCM